MNSLLEPVVTVRLDTSLPEPGQLLAAIASPACGASVLFAGSARRHTGSRETEWLEYECYPAMALAELERLAHHCCQMFGAGGVAIAHRLGKVPAGQTSILIAVATPHRVAAFRAVEWLMEEIKARVPIWKKDFAPDGTGQWIHPDLPVQVGSRTSVAGPREGMHDGSEDRSRGADREFTTDD